MPTLYKSILLVQPADGDVVIVRRFTRDPPVLATWFALLRMFIAGSTFNVNIIGSTLAGSHAVTYNTTYFGPTVPVWAIVTGPAIIYFYPRPDGFMQFGAEDGSGNGFVTNQSNPNLITPNGISFTTLGTAPYGTPTAISFNAADSSQQYIPAALISAWRPQ